MSAVVFYYRRSEFATDSKFTIRSVFSTGGSFGGAHFHGKRGLGAPPPPPNPPYTPLAPPPPPPLFWKTPPPPGIFSKPPAPQEKGGGGGARGRGWGGGLGKPLLPRKRAPFSAKTPWGRFDESGENDEFAVYPLQLKTRASLLRPPKTTKMTKMAGVTQARHGLEKTGLVLS